MGNIDGRKSQRAFPLSSSSSFSSSSSVFPGSRCVCVFLRVAIYFPLLLGNGDGREALF
jgi:hypothetical protein